MADQDLRALLGFCISTCMKVRFPFPKWLKSRPQKLSPNHGILHTASGILYLYLVAGAQAPRIACIHFEQWTPSGPWLKAQFLGLVVHTTRPCRGGADIDAIVKRLDLWGVDMLFVVGGDGGGCKLL